jgi:2-keto-3-deoxy-L-rhamnonate aldolase RhmA
MRNVVRQAAATGTRIRGLHLTFPSTTIIELLAIAGVDFIFLDGEHGAFDLRDIEACCVAGERHDLTVFARVPNRAPDNDRAIPGPRRNRHRRAARGERIRSFGGGRPDYGVDASARRTLLEQRNSELSIGIMLESRQSLEAAGEIAKLPSRHYVSFGLNDLAQSLGHPGEPTHPVVRAAVDAATEVVHAAGKRIREDFMDFAWINDVVLTDVRQLLP